VYRARGDRFLGHGFHSTLLSNPTGVSHAVRIGPHRKLIWTSAYVVAELLGIAKSHLSERFQTLSLTKMLAGFEISSAIGNFVAGLNKVCSPL
jgi:hypothetical protein